MALEKLWNSIWKNYKTTTFALLLAWCWWWGWDENTTPPKPETPQIEYITWYIQAWYISWADVNIYSKDNKIIYTTKTDEKWKYSIDKNIFLQNLKINWLNENSKLIIKATWWTDIDPDDDWNINNDNDEVVNWSLESIVSYNNIQNSVTNPISTKVTKIILSDNAEILTNSELFESILKEVLTKLLATDINKDWVLNMLDIINYDMVKYESKAEDDTKIDGTLEYIHSWDTTKLDDAVNNVFLKTNLITSTQNYNNWIYEIKFTKPKNDIEILYSFDWNNWTNYTPNTSIDLQKWKSIFYKQSNNDIIKAISYEDSNSYDYETIKVVDKNPDSWNWNTDTWNWNTDTWNWNTDTWNWNTDT